LKDVCLAKFFINNKYFCLYLPLSVLSLFINQKKLTMKADQNKLVVFQEKEIRRVWHNEEWYFSISDIVQALTDSKDVRSYIKKMKKRDTSLSEGWGQIVTSLPMKAAGGR